MSDIKKQEKQELENSLGSRIYELFKAHKAVSAISITEATFIEYFNTITKLNSLARWTTSLDGKPLESYLIPKVLEGLILPDSVTLTGSDNEHDLLKRPSAPSEYMSFEKFTNCTYMLAGLFASNGSDNVKFARGAMKLGDLDGKGSYNGKVVEFADSFYPVPLSFHQYSEARYTLAAEEMIVRAVRQTMVATRK